MYAVIWCRISRYRWPNPNVIVLPCPWSITFHTGLNPSLAHALNWIFWPGVRNEPIRPTANHVSIHMLLYYIVRSSNKMRRRLEGCMVVAIFSSYLPPFDEELCIANIGKCSNFKDKIFTILNIYVFKYILI